MPQNGTQQARELSVLHEFSEALTRQPDQDELYRLVLSALQRLIPCDVAALALATDPVPRVLLREGRPLAKAVREQAEPIVCGALQKLTGISATAAQISHQEAPADVSGPEGAGDIQSIGTVPLNMGEQVIGALSVLSLQEDAFDPEAVRLAETLANQAVSAIARLWATPMAHRWPLEAVLEAVPDALLLLTPAGDILAHNSCAEGLLPLLTGDHQRAGPVRRLDSPELRQALTELFAGGNDTATELELAHDGRPRILGLRLMRLAAGPGDETALAHVRDVSQERALHDQVYRNARLASIGELTAGVAHELNNPLTTILGFADLLLRAQLPSQATDDIGKIHAAALRSRKIAHDVLSFARGSTPGMTMFDLNEALCLPIRLVRKHFAADDVEIMEALDPALPPVYGDMGQLQQVLLNLLQNARDAIAGSGIGSSVLVGTRPTNGSAVVEVKDDGPGMPEELQQKVFDPFFTTKPPGEGSGLGLSIAHRIVERHGGTICVTSRPGEGTCFAIELPIQAHSAASAEEAAGPLEEDATGHEAAPTGESVRAPAPAGKPHEALE